MVKKPQQNNLQLIYIILILFTKQQAFTALVELKEYMTQWIDLTLYNYILKQCNTDLVQIARSNLRGNVRWFNLCLHFSHTGAWTLAKIGEGNSIPLLWASFMLGLFSRCRTSCIRDVVQQTMTTKFRTAPAPLALGEFPNFSVILLQLLCVC